MPTETLRPNGVGDNSELVPIGDAPNWKCVDDVASDGDTTYVRSSTTDDLPYLDLYNIDASAIPAGSTINWVTVYVMIRNVSPTILAIFRIAVKKSGEAVQYWTVTTTTTYTLRSRIFAGITQADLDALQIGIEITSVYDDAFETYRQGRCTQAYVVIDYTEAAVGVASKRLLVGVGL